MRKRGKREEEGRARAKMGEGARARGSKRTKVMRKKIREDRKREEEGEGLVLRMKSRSIHMAYFKIPPHIPHKTYLYASSGRLVYDLLGVKKTILCVSDSSFLWQGPDCCLQLILSQMILL